MELMLLDKKGKRLSETKFLEMKFSGILIQDIRKYFKSGNRVYFSFHKQPVYGTGMFFSMFNKHTHKANIPINKLYDYLKEISIVEQTEFYSAYAEMTNKDYDTFTLPDK